MQYEDVYGWDDCGDGGGSPHRIADLANDIALPSIVGK